MVKFDALFDPGTQVNLINEDLINKLGLHMHDHPHLYLCVTGNRDIHVTKAVSSEIHH